MMKNYIITGASSGIGEACVRILASSENRLIVVGRNIEKLRSMATELDGEIIPVQYDLSNLGNIKDVFCPCQEKNFKLDGLVYCAGLDGTWPIKTNNYENMQKIMNVNCFAFVEMCKFFFSKRFSNDNSSIVAVSSIASLTAEKGMVAYSISKAALNTAVKTAAKEFSRRGIRVNAILPAGVQTPMADAKGELLKVFASKPAEDEHPREEIQPFGMIPRDNIAEQLIYLLSDKARFITGELMVVSAGRPF